jgi:hypothetical protein
MRMLKSSSDLRKMVKVVKLSADVARRQVIMCGL